MNLLIKGWAFGEGYTEIATPDNSLLEELQFGRLRLSTGGKPYEDQTANLEVVLTVLSGKADVEIESEGGVVLYQEIGERDDVFSGSPTLVYVPPQSSCRVSACSPHFDAVIAKAPATGPGKAALIPAGAVEVISVGAANWRRRVNLGAVERGPTQRLMVGETINPPGNWSSYPPHKHDSNHPPHEGRFEEVYFYLTRPDGGFGLQRLYERREGEDALDEVYVVESGDTVVIPRGYHPVVAAPGYQLYYFWALLGREKRYRAWSDDPAYEWIRQVEPMLVGG